MGKDPILALLDKKGSSYESLDQVGGYLQQFRVELCYLLVLGIALLGLRIVVHGWAAAGALLYLAVMLLLWSRHTRRWIFKNLERSRIRRRWDLAVNHCGLPHAIPMNKIERVEGGYRARVRVGRGVSFVDLERRREELAACLRIRELKVKRDLHNAATGTVTLVRDDPLSGKAGATWPTADRVPYVPRAPRHPGRSNDDGDSDGGGGGGGDDRGPSPGPPPMLSAGDVSLWRAIPVGIDEHGDVVSVALPERNMLVGGVPGSGKALDIDTPVPTPDGWTTMGDLQTGQRVFDEAGNICTVTDAWPVLHGRPCYQIQFDDGSTVIADEDHLWVTETWRDRRNDSAESSRKREGVLPDSVIEGLRKVALEPGETSLWDLAARVGATQEDPNLGVSRNGIRFGIFYGVAQTVPYRAGIVQRRVDGRPDRLGTRKLHTRLQPTRLFRTGELATALVERGSERRWDQRKKRNPVTTLEILRTLHKENDKRLNHSIPCAAPLGGEQKKLLIPPYALGCWLGDGVSGGDRFTTADPEDIGKRLAEDGVVLHSDGSCLGYAMRYLEEKVRDDLVTCKTCGKEFKPTWRRHIYCSRECYRSRVVAYHRCHTCQKIFPWTGGGRGIYCSLRCCGKGRGKRLEPDVVEKAISEFSRTFYGDLRTLGVRRNKHIPIEYLRASVEQRRALLAGLLDTDGTRGGCKGGKGGGGAGNQVSFSSTRERLARDVYHLVASLGYKPTMQTKRVKGRTEETSISYSVHFSTSDETFCLTRKWRTRDVGERSTTSRRYIVDVRSVRTRPVRCIAVDSPNRLFLVGESCIATHNSAATSMLLATAAIDPTVRIYLIDGKMVEFAEWEDCADGVGHTLDNAIYVLTRLQALMLQRYQKLREMGLRKVEEGSGFELIILFVDELALFMSSGDTKKSKEFTVLITDLVARGRAAGIIVVAATQKPEGSVISTNLRDLFAYRWALACGTPQASDTVLGQGWAARGFNAATIPIGEAGTGYLLAEDGVPTRLRTFYLNDDNIRALAAHAREVRGL